MHEGKNKKMVDTVFKAKHPKRYIQVKTSVINKGEQIIAICTDITKFKQGEALMQKVRSLFFSSVAHELRTPLNSIIPILRMIIMILTPIQHLLPANTIKSLQIVLNSALHL